MTSLDNIDDLLKKNLVNIKFYKWVIFWIHSKFCIVNELNQKDYTSSVIHLRVNLEFVCFVGRLIIY